MDDKVFIGRNSMDETLLILAAKCGLINHIRRLDLFEILRFKQNSNLFREKVISLNHCL